MTDQQKFCELGIAVIETEANAILALKNRINATFATACQYLLGCQGRIVVLGMGKSGHIGNKIAATLASTGSPSFFVHPGEAGHGDLGMITAKDVVLAISNSGETSEIVLLLPLIKRLGIPLISMTGNSASTIAKTANVDLDISVEKEACPLGLAPTSSTTAALVMGDALAIALLEARGFTADDFALSHPGGALGRRLLLRINDVMRTGIAVPSVYENAALTDALVEMTAKRLGMTTILKSDGRLAGVFTDGDLRRVLDQGLDVHSIKINDVMTSDCKTIPPGLLASEAISIMETHKITALVVADQNLYPVGIVHLHDLLSAGVA